MTKENKVEFVEESNRLRKNQTSQKLARIFRQEDRKNNLPIIFVMSRRSETCRKGDLDGVL